MTNAGPLPTRESHNVEFKKSLALVQEGAKAIVAFANTHGGDLYFGIDPKGKVAGVDVGENTLEKLASDLEAHIYPYAPVAIDELKAANGKTVIQLSVVADTPPVVGVYLYSSARLRTDDAVAAEQLHAYRRVGRSTREVPDFMWLRGTLPSDPVVLIDGGSASSAHGYPASMNCAIWLAGSNGSAYDIRISTEPRIFDEGQAARDLPTSKASTGVVLPIRLDFGDTRPPDIWLTANYRDEWGCVWQSRRLLQVQYGQNPTIIPTSEFSRRIVSFPPKTRSIS